MQARQIMSEHPVCITPNATVRDAARLMHEHDVGLLPVVDPDDDRHVVGVITDRDIALRCVARGRGPDTRVREAMSREVAVARPRDDVKEVMSLMGREQVRRIPVVDERAGLVGVIAQADVILRADDRRAEHTVERISRESEKHAQ